MLGSLSQHPKQFPEKKEVGWTVEVGGVKAEAGFVFMVSFSPWTKTTFPGKPPCLAPLQLGGVVLAHEVSRSDKHQFQALSQNLCGPPCSLPLL